VLAWFVWGKWACARVGTRSLGLVGAEDVVDRRTDSVERIEMVKGSWYQP
jgi:hypothetical protein